MAGMAPPTVPPLFTPTKNDMPIRGSKTNVNGIAIAVAIIGPMPGTAPTNWPIITPIMINIKFWRLKASPKPNNIISNSTIVISSR